MACNYPEDCGEYAVTPMLVAPCYPTRCCDDAHLSYPSLPRCNKGVVNCCEKRRPRSPPWTSQHHCRDECDHRYHEPWHGGRPRRYRSPAAAHHSPDHYCTSPYHQACKPVKTKYVIPCYRYEDGRIQNQPTVLTRRACEVAVGARVRSKPFVVSSYSADPVHEERRFHSEDERGNCCFHFERKKCHGTHDDLHSHHHHGTHLHGDHLHGAHGHGTHSHGHGHGVYGLGHGIHGHGVGGYGLGGYAYGRGVYGHGRGVYGHRHGVYDRELGVYGLGYGSYGIARSLHGHDLHGHRHHSDHAHLPCLPCTSKPECEFKDCVHARAVSPMRSCCFYC